MQTRAILILTAVLLGPTLDRADAQLLGETPVDNVPMDLTVTPDGLMAAIRNSDEGAGNGVEMVSVWHLPTNAKLGLAGCPPAGTWALGEPSPLASDGVQATNSRAIVIGSYDDPNDPVVGQETTHVDILNIDTAADPPTTVSCLWNYAFNQS